MKAMLFLFLAGSLVAGADDLAASKSAVSNSVIVQPDAGTKAVREAGTKQTVQLVEATRAACIEGRRFICGKVLQVEKDGLVVDSGYTALLEPPFNRSWVVRGNVSVVRDAALIEGKSAGSPCAGLVFLTDLPKKPTAKLYDYVTIQAYPAGQYDYEPVPGVKKTIRKFASRLSSAVKLTLERREKQP